MDLPRAFGGASLHGVLRATPEDFFVDEDLGFAADGSGEHVLVRVEKRGANTDFVAKELARFAGVRAEAVSYAGLKDRHAVTRQTFSIHLPGKADPEWAALAHAEFRVLEALRHSRKLQRGALKGNRFRIVLREVEGDRAAAERVFDAIRTQGVPNYFGEQRFGRESMNVEKARRMFAGGRVQRHERSLFLSAARSHLFNAVLAERVEKGNWNRPLDGDVFMLAGTHSIFGPEPLTAELGARLERGDIAPTGPMWGAGELRTRDAVAELENSVAARFPELAAGLASAGLRQERRSLVLRPRELELRWLQDSGTELRFYLNSGSYATVLLSEIFDYQGQA
ncbi:MAG TPA: tRNA pseudouridine(13) synthase TruD [Rudaea sp.]|nr:tRNA pseudouridine(13) synthase TruD [Rudaea sp.]